MKQVISTQITNIIISEKHEVCLHHYIEKR